MIPAELAPLILVMAVVLLVLYWACCCRGPAPSANPPQRPGCHITATYIRDMVRRENAWIGGKLEHLGVTGGGAHEPQAPWAEVDTGRLPDVQAPEAAGIPQARPPAAQPDAEAAAR